MLYLCFLVSALIVAAATTHLHWCRGRGAIVLSSLLLGTMVTVAVLIWGAHHCEEGRPPAYLPFVGGLMAGAVPWCRSFSIAIRRVLAFCISMLFITLVGLLVSSYHSQEITGNAEMANGRYWHTALTGMYPRGTHPGWRESALLDCLLERMEQPHDGPDGGGEPHSPKTPTPH